MRKFLLAVALLAGCSEDNEAIRSRADDVYRYTHWSHTSTKQRDTAKLHFWNETTNQAMTWKGDVRDAMVYLEQIDKGRCYLRPVTRDQAEEVPCG